MSTVMDRIRAVAAKVELARQRDREACQRMHANKFGHDELLDLTPLEWQEFAVETHGEIRSQLITCDGIADVSDYVEAWKDPLRSAEFKKLHYPPAEQIDVCKKWFSECTFHSGDGWVGLSSVPTQVAMWLATPKDGRWDYSTGSPWQHLRSPFPGACLAAAIELGYTFCDKGKFVGIEIGMVKKCDYVDINQSLYYDCKSGHERFRKYGPHRDNWDESKFHCPECNRSPEDD